jgi:hypothetical protein
MAKVRLDVGATVDFLNKDELADALKSDRLLASAAERERLSGIKYLRGARIQGTVYDGTIGNAGGTTFPAGTQYAVLGGTWGPMSGYAWSIRRVAIGGLSNAGSVQIQDTVALYRNNNSAPPLGILTAGNPSITFPTLGCVLLGGDSLVIGHYPNQTGANMYGTLGTACTQLAADFDIIECPQELLGKLA